MTNVLVLGGTGWLSGRIARDWVEGLSFDALREATGAPLADGRVAATA